MERLQFVKQIVFNYLSTLGWKKSVLLIAVALHILNKIRIGLGLVMKKSLHNEIVFLTGAASGIGRQLAFRLARLGARVVVADINITEAERVANAILQEKKHALAVECNVANHESVHQAAQKCRSTYGHPTMLINNAGIVAGKKLHETTIQEMERIIQVNLVSNLYTLKEFLPNMISNNKGHIVTIASAAAIQGMAGLVDYTASKYGQYGLDEALRIELKHMNSSKFYIGVKTTCVCPYFINTGMFKGVQLNSRWLVNMLDEIYVANRIIQAIQTNEEVLVMPNSVYVTVLLKAIFPSQWIDRFTRWLGLTSSMDTFKGRGG